MHLNPLDLAIFAIYIAAVLALGLLAARRGTKTKREYFLAGDKLPWWMVGGSIVAANISSHQLVGSMGLAYSRGFVAMVTEWGMILVGLNALLWIFLPFYLRNGFYTVPEFLNRRFGPSVRTTYAALILLTYLVVEIGAVLYTGSLALNTLLGIRLSYSIIALAAVTGIYTILGGLRAVVWTEMLQLTILLLGGIALSVATIHHVGGLHAALVASGETSGKWHLLMPYNDPAFPWTMYLGGTLCISTFYAAANQFIVQRALAAKNEWHARMGIIFTDYLKFLIPMIIIVPGLLAPSLFPNLPKADFVFPTLVKNLLPTGVIGLVMAGLIAAVMGHTSGAINSVSTIATMDFYLPLLQRRRSRNAGFQPERTNFQTDDKRVLDYAKPSTGQRAVSQADDLTTDSEAVRFGRIFGIFTIIVGVICAELLTTHSQKPIFLYLMDAYGYFAPGLATMFLVGILWKRTTTAGALAAGILTIPMSAIMQWRWPHFPFQNRTGVVFWTCIIVCILVSLMTTPKSPEELEGLIWTPASLRLPPEQRAHYRGLRRPLWWWAIITAVVIFFYIRFA